MPIEPLRLFQHRRGKFVPVVNQVITIDVPGERLRAVVLKVQSDDELVVEIQSVVVDKHGHGYKRGDIESVQRGTDSIGQPTWAVISEREMRNREKRAQLEAEQRAAEDEAAERRVAEIRARDLAAQAEAEASQPVTRVTESPQSPSQETQGE